MKSLKFSAVVAAVSLALGLASNQASAVGVQAGQSITNTATVDYTVGTVTATSSSNTTTLTVAEILNVTVTAQTPSVPVSPGQTGQAIRYRVDNTGNGPEAFHLVLNSNVTGDNFDPVAASPSIYLDNGDGVFGAGDVPYVAGSNDPQLNPDAFAIIFVVHNIPTTVTDNQTGRVTLSASARTGTGAPGTVFAGQGVAGTDAVVGTTGATATTLADYLVQAVTVTANKTQVVLDQFGGNRPVPGAKITYTVKVDAVGSGTATGMLFSDVIPPNTTYVAGTLKLNGTALTDGVDADAGEFDTAPNNHVHVTLGNLTQAGGTQTIDFAVTIN
jgi:uncharacterized repeat protein (TIGR01451 family)